MAIPKNILKEHLLKAIEKIDQDGIPKDGDSQYYDVLYKGKRYPPKLIVSYANLFSNGVELDRNTFHGGLNTPSFILLEKNGFDIIPKKEINSEKNYYPELSKFLSQARTNDLRTFGYIRDFEGLKIKISFGQGNQARVPWIAFLNNIDKVQNGIYPVYLFFKEKNLLILSYGVSETNVPLRKWNIPNSKTIENLFSERNLGEPPKYKNSFVFKCYDLEDEINENQINKDLQNIISIYKEINPLMPQLEFNFNSFNLSSIQSGFLMEKNLIVRFCASLITKPFVILTGLSGSGKTKLAQTFVQWICLHKKQYLIIPVGADWTNREPLLGYPNALNNEEYVKPDSGVLDLIIEANKQYELPHFLILDEMNLSHVERYFADFLSVMESKDEIRLFSEGKERNDVPSKLKLPSNLFIIGTVNIDETTNMFSPKVLDRANTIEFRVTKEEMENFLKNVRDINMNELIAKGADMARNFNELASKKSIDNISDVEQKEINRTLVDFFHELKKTGAEFGYRSAAEILRLIQQLTVLDETLGIKQKIDIAIIQKLLPKLHGSRRKLCPVLETLGSLCVNKEIKVVKDIFDKTDFDFNNDLVVYPMSLEKISRMYRSAIDNGFASFAEA
jgi:5-methylcytosine-specific restriction protein B